MSVTLDVVEQSALASRLADNLDEAFPQFVACYETVAYSIALRLIGRHDEALDLSAEVFHHAYRALHGYPAAQIHDLKLRPWLVTIVLNLCRNAARSKARQPREVVLDEAIHLSSSTMSPEQSALQQDSQEQLVRCLLRLSVAQQTAVVLHHVVGLPFEEIALVLSCPATTARSHNARGLMQLRKFLGSPQESD